MREIKISRLSEIYLYDLSITLETSKEEVIEKLIKEAWENTPPKKQEIPPKNDWWNNA